MRIAYPLLWSRPGRDACRDQSINTVAALARRGVEMTLLMPQRPGDPALTADDLRSYFDVEGDFRLIQRKSRWEGAKVLPSTAWLRALFRDPAVLGSNLLYSRIPNMFVMGGTSPVPFAADHYRPWPDHLPWLRPFIRRTAASSACLGFVIHSHFSADSYARCGVPDPKLLVAHNGADPRRMEPRLGKAEARALLGLPEGRSIALYAGRVNEKKGLESILAVAKLRPEVLFVFVGSEREGAFEHAAAAYSNVKVVGWQEPGRLSAWLYAADALLIPPTRAPLEKHRNCVLPIKTFQYLAAGRPIIAPVSPDTAELLRDGSNALLVPAEDPQAACTALDRVLLDASLAQRLSANAHLLAEGLTWDARAEKIETFLHDRLEAQREARPAARRRPAVIAHNIPAP